MSVQVYGAMHLCDLPDPKEQWFYPRQSEGGRVIPPDELIFRCLVCNKMWSINRWPVGFFKWEYSWSEYKGPVSP